MPSQKAVIHGTIGTLYYQVDQLKGAIDEAKLVARETSDGAMADELLESIPQLEAQIRELEAEIDQLNRQLAELESTGG